MRRHGGPGMHVTERETPVGKGRLPCGAAIGCSGKGKRDGEKVGGGQELGRRERREEDTGVSREAILRGTAWWVHVSGRLSTHRAGIAPRGALCTARTLRDGRVSVWAGWCPRATPGTGRLWCVRAVGTGGL